MHDIIYDYDQLSYCDQTGKHDFSPGWGPYGDSKRNQKNGYERLPKPPLPAGQFHCQMHQRIHFPAARRQRAVCGKHVYDLTDGEG